MWADHIRIHYYSKMKRFLSATAFLLLLCGYGCQSNNAVITDQLPDFIPKEQTHSTVMLTVGEEHGDQFGGSAIILTDTKLITNRHVWTNSDEWWNIEPKKEQKLGFFYTCKKCDKLHKNSEIFEFIAMGEINTKLDTDSSEFLIERNRSDWVLIETKKPFWDSLLGAPIYLPSLDPDWHAPNGTNLYVLGFSSIFKNDEKQSAFIQNGPYTIAGKAIEAGELHALQYNINWPTPLGHSGGGVYIWNEDTKQLELIGVFHSQSSASILLRLFKMKVLLYSPIADPFQHLLYKNN